MRTYVVTLATGEKISVQAEEFEINNETSVLELVNDEGYVCAAFHHWEYFILKS